MSYGGRGWLKTSYGGAENVRIPLFREEGFKIAKKPSYDAVAQNYRKS